jgi:hypothetical protein
MTRRRKKYCLSKRRPSFGEKILGILSSILYFENYAQEFPKNYSTTRRRKNYKQESGSCWRDRFGKIVFFSVSKTVYRGVQKTEVTVRLGRNSKPKNIPLGVTNPEKLLTFSVSKIRHRPVQNHGAS